MRAEFRKLQDMTEPELRELMDGYHDALKAEAIVKRVDRPQYVLLVFNDPEIAQYIATVNRSDAIKALREAANRIERNQILSRVPFDNTAEQDERSEGDDTQGVTGIVSEDKTPEPVTLTAGEMERINRRLQDIRCDPMNRVDGMRGCGRGSTDFKPEVALYVLGTTNDNHNQRPLAAMQYVCECGKRWALVTEVDQQES